MPGNPIGEQIQFAAYIILWVFADVFGVVCAYCSGSFASDLGSLLFYALFLPWSFVVLLRAFALIRANRLSAGMLAFLAGLFSFVTVLSVLFGLISFIIKLLALLFL